MNKKLVFIRAILKKHTLKKLLLIMKDIEVTFLLEKIWFIHGNDRVSSHLISENVALYSTDKQKD